MNNILTKICDSLDFIAMVLIVPFLMFCGVAGLFCFIVLADYLT
jgi:hypothetical protein